MIAPISSFAPALSAVSARGLTSLSMSAGAGGYKPWDVKQEGGQMDSVWGGGEMIHISNPQAYSICICYH